MATPSKVQPLRITKSTSGDINSPNRMPAARPLAEIGSNEHRRNSPSYNQATRKAIVSREASPYTENSFTKDSSPRSFWSLKDAMTPSRFDSENSPDPASSASLLSIKRRASIEKLKQAGRVKTSNIFALETKTTYDPANVPLVERPIANRPLSESMANNTFTRYDSLRKENSPMRSPQAIAAQRRAELRASHPGPVSANGISTKAASSPSPTKSSLARNSQFGSTLYDPERAMWPEEDDRGLTPRSLRQNKSVTFREEPPVVNEYEQPTPEPSISATSGSREGSWDSDEYYEQDYSFERGSSMEQHDDSFDDDLENADKTPVVLPEQWSRVSPEHARTDLANDEDDVFGTSSTSPHRNFSCTESITSDGESRPLPPLPGSGLRGMHSASKRITESKTEVSEMNNTSNERPNHCQSSPMVGQDTENDSFVTGLDVLSDSPPRISRESILRKVRSRRFDLEDANGESVDEASPHRQDYADLDPDVPIPSREISEEAEYLGSGEVQKHTTTAHDGLRIKSEPVDDETFDMSAIPSAEHDESALFGASPFHRQSSVLRHRVHDDSDDDATESRESTVEPEAESTELHGPMESTPEVNDGKETLQDAMQLLTVKDYSQPEALSTVSQDFMGLPSYVSTDDYDFGIQKYIEASPPASETSLTQKLDITASAPSLPPPTASNLSPWRDLPRPTYDGAEYSPPGTPESMVRHEDHDVSSLDTIDVEQIADQPEAPMDPVTPEISVEIPERRATIRTGGKLKTRPSATPADFVSMAEQRRMVSAERHAADVEEDELAEYEAGPEVLSTATVAASTKQQDLGISLEVPTWEENDGLGLDKEFDRVIESQKKGYLMRQNTKLVVASTRNFSNESSCTARSNESATGQPRASTKTGSRSGTKEQVLKTEPWNGKTRRQSHRVASMCATEPAPPLPGQQSALGVVEEDFAAGTSSLEDDVGDDVERGRLFVKVVGVKNLELPLPRNDRTYFQLTLDNGLHCVTTSDLEMGKSAPIGQEFELVVLNDLEFQLTLTTKLPPPVKEVDVSASAAASAAKKGSTRSAGFSRFLSSPKKRAERERQEREAMEAEERKRKEDLMRKRASVRPSAWDLLRDLVNATDGSFARAYVNLKAHERDCFGRALTVDVPCYNEWALEKDDVVINSVRNKRGTQNGPVRRPPYIIGHLELQLLYIPRPKGAAEEDMPKSMSGAVREINRADKEVSNNVEITHEGHLSQQGGDCQHWRRRFFRLQGPKLTAYHEHTHQKRAVINLSKAFRLVDDKNTLVADPVPSTSTSKAKRRKSAFAEEDEGYAYVEEGFRIRFANGETIDFYADCHADKVSWMKKLAQVIGKPAVAAEKRALRWTDLVHAREKAEQQAEKDAAKTEVKDFGSTTLAQSTAPAPPAKDRVAAIMSPKPPPVVGSETRASTPPMNARTAPRSRDAVKSMIF